jgi:D-alanyl-D-alanine carboxypeptidase
MLIGLFVCGWASPAQAGGTRSAADGSFKPKAGQLPAAQRKRITTAIRLGFHESSAPGAIVGVQTPRGTLVKAIGTADVDSGAPVRASMYHRIGSVTKTFIGTLMMQLAGEGKLSLGDPISDYVAGVPNGEAITLRQLVNMTSGLSSYTESDDWLNLLYSNPSRVWHASQLLPFGYPSSPLFAPGARFNYSDSNFTLLGLVIRQVTGRSMSSVLNRRILEPLGLRHTFWPGNSPALPRPHTHGYTLQGQPPDEPGDATNWNPTYAGAAGAMVSKVRDLLVYARALATGRGLLSPRLQRKRLAAFEPVSLKAPLLSYGIALLNDAGWIGHNGSVPGYTTTVYYHQATRTAVVVESNSDIVSGSCPGQETLLNDPFAGPCSGAADNIMATVAEALGTPYQTF